MSCLMQTALSDMMMVFKEDLLLGRTEVEYELELSLTSKQATTRNRSDRQFAQNRNCKINYLRNNMQFILELTFSSRSRRS